MQAVDVFQAPFDFQNMVVRPPFRVFIGIVSDAFLGLGDKILQFFKSVFFAFQSLVEVIDDIPVPCQCFFRDDVAVDFLADAGHAAAQRLDVEAHFLDLPQSQDELAFFQLFA